MVVEPLTPTNYKTIDKPLAARTLSPLAYVYVRLERIESALGLPPLSKDELKALVRQRFPELADLVR